MGMTTRDTSSFVWPVLELRHLPFLSPPSAEFVIDRIPHNPQSCMGYPLSFI